MKYCSYCGSSVNNNANYCPNCGGALSGGTKDVMTVYGEPVDLDTGYRIILFSRGTCSLKTAREVLCDLLGYTTSTSDDLLSNMPIEVADELTELQAITIAQALSEYGMEVTIVDENDQYVDFNDKAKSSVFDSTGSLIASAVAALATLSAANRVHRYRRYKKPSLLQLLFRPRYVVPVPVVHKRRNVVHHPEPRYRYEVRKPQPMMMTKPKPDYNSRPASKPSSNIRVGTGFGVKPAVKQAGNTGFSNRKPAGKTSTSSGFGTARQPKASKASTGLGVHKSASHSAGNKPSLSNRQPAGRGTKKR